MTNEFDGTEIDPAWAALTANDPALLAPNLEFDALKASVLSEAIKVAPISKRSWLAPVAVAASLALFVGGGAGYTIAAQSTSDPSTSITAPAPEIGAPSGGQDSRISSDSKLALGSYVGLWGGGGRPYLDAGAEVSDKSGTQVGYTFDASGVDRKTQLELIADAFGIKGKITGNKTDGYFVGDKSYATQVGQVSGASWDHLVTWYYNNESVMPKYCGDGMTPTDSKSSSGSATDDVSTSAPEPAPASSNCELPNGVLPTDGSALTLARGIFESLGFDNESANWSVVDAGWQWGYSNKSESGFKLVTAKILINGINTYQSWTMTVGPDSAIINATGFFAKFVPTSEYNIVGAKTAIERSQSALWSNLPPQEVFKDGKAYPMESLALSGNPNAVKRNKAGQPIIDANIDRINISKAESSLLAWYLSDGSMILLPAYLLSESNADDSRQWLQLAIADEYVDFN